MDIGLLILGLVSLIGTAITAAVNATSVNRTNRTNMDINQRQMDHADKAAEDADRRTRALYNDIESPQAQKRALLDAGLSPGLIYGQSGVGGSVQSGAQAQSPAMLGAIPFQMSNIMDVSQSAEMAKANAEIANINTDTESKKADLPIKEQMKANIQQEILNKKQEISESQMRVQKLFAETQNEYKRSNNIEKEKELMEAQKAYNEALTALTNINVKDQHSINAAQIQNLKAKSQEAIALAKKAGIEAATLEKTMQSTIDKAYAEAQMTIFDWTFLRPSEFEKIQQQVTQLRNTNDKEKALSEIYGSWKGHARAQEIKDWFKVIAGLGGAAGIITNAAKAAAK